MNNIYHGVLLRVQVKGSTSREQMEEHSVGLSWHQAQGLYVTDVCTRAAPHTSEIGFGLLLSDF
jgi:hypothetical protein